MPEDPPVPITTTPATGRQHRAAVMDLRRGPGQDQYLNSMADIFDEADEEQRALPHPWAVRDAQTGALPQAVSTSVAAGSARYRRRPLDRPNRAILAACARCSKRVACGQ
jgi:hypothetical protein